MEYFEDKNHNVIGDKILINSDGKMSAKIMLSNHTDDNDLDQSFFKQQLVKNWDILSDIYRLNLPCSEMLTRLAAAARESLAINILQFYQNTHQKRWNRLNWTDSVETVRAHLDRNKHKL